MSDAYDSVETMAEALLAKRPSPAPDEIRKLIRDLSRAPEFALTPEEAERMAREFEVRHGVTMTIGSVLTEREYKPWLDKAKIDINPYYWKRYRSHLGQKHFSGQVIATLDQVTERILGLLENPAEDGPWDRRGMVVGHVQSGKTANYIGLICKAADAGYRVIIVIAGIHNNLRNQTQVRIDEGFVGRDSARLLSRKGDKFVGVGAFDKTRRPVTFTNSLKDFNKAMATAVGVPLQTLNEPAVFVIKKNSSTLRHLLQWLSEHSAQAGAKTIGAPMLLIDDEADNASINIKHGKDEVSTINGQIRELLHLFERSCYVGYTATPFANIFIDPDTDDEMLGADLFPRNFIVTLDPPSNYFGPDRVFLDEPGLVVRYIDDSEDTLALNHTKELEVTGLPESMLSALRTFVVARAIRLARGHSSFHSSMLVNASRFTNVQRQLRNELHHRLEMIQSSARVNGALPEEKALKDPELRLLHEAWRCEYEGTGLGWAAIQPWLNAAAAPITVVEVNSRSSGGLDYAGYAESGLSVVAVGGYSLSRGLTLEGLMITYFLRNSIMYDTLMQMGRWFGYRPGYEDLCRIWMPEEAEGWYSHIAESIEMLREELRTMEAAKATPEEFGLKVRSHPDTLIVTARNKMGSSEEVVWKVGLSNNFIETATLHRTPEVLATNRRNARRFGQQLAALGLLPSEARQVPGGWLVANVPVDPVVDFITSFVNHLGSPLTDPSPVRRYIDERRRGELSNWDVLLAGTQDGSATLDESMGVAIRRQQRSAGTKTDESTLRITNKQRVASRGIEKTGLSAEQVREAERKYRREKGASDKAKVNFPDRIYRAVRERPLLIIHLLDINPPGTVAEAPVIAWSISFPKTQLEEDRVEYRVNTRWLRENLGSELEEDEMEGDRD